MAKSLIDIKSPFQVSGKITDISNWTGAILWVIMFGFVFAVGVKALNFIDAKLPGKQTPDMIPYKQTVEKSLTIL